MKQVWQCLRDYLLSLIGLQLKKDVGGSLPPDDDEKKGDVGGSLPPDDDEDDETPPPKKP